MVDVLTVGRPSIRLPSISVLVVATCMVMAVPLVWIGLFSWAAAEERVAAAQDATKSAERLEVLVRLAPVLGSERMSASSAIGTDDLVVGLPPDALGLLGLDFAASLAADRKAVDVLLDDHDDEDFRSEVGALRRASDSGELSVFEVLDRYDALVEQLAAAINAELDALTDAATAAGDVDVVVAARVAEAAAGLQLVTTGQDLQWVRLEVQPFITPSVDDINRFTTAVALFDYQLGEFEQIVAPDSAVGREWQALQQLETTTTLRHLHAATVADYAASGVPETAAEQTTIDVSSAELGELIATASDITAGLSAAREFSAGLASVVDASLAEVESSADQAVVGARQDRVLTVVWIAAWLVLFGAAAVTLIVLIARPVRRMGHVAQSITLGEHDIQLDQRGPKEIRVASQAMSEALATLRTAEAQADALAEERLDDPILASPAPGRLGSSIQAAVDRLASSMVEREEFQRQLAHEASHDGLTKLANRKAIIKHLTSALARTQRASTKLALLFLDVDDFKAVNDSHGHQTGDFVLRTIAQRLVAATREGDLVGRLGGDEFVVIAEPVRDIDDAVYLTARIVDNVTQPITIDGVTVHPSISIGIGLADDDLTADELLFDADLAVYRAKSLGKGRVEICDESLRHEVQARTKLEDSLRSAIANDELVLFYQPTVDTRSGRITSLEALIRWNQQGDTIIPPDSFIPIAERSDLIIDIDRWVLHEAARQLAAWSLDDQLGSIPIAVNISGRHLGSGCLYRDVQSALEASGVQPDRLILEVTETALLEDLATAAHELGQLRRTGVRIALDDFGTGYMSLAHLRGLPVDVLKIDRSFVASLETDAEKALVQLIVDTGHLLGVAVTAEGVETQTQAEALSEMGSDYLQGYLYSRPQDANATEDHIHGELARNEASASRQG